MRLAHIKAEGQTFPTARAFVYNYLVNGKVNKELA